ncbi:MAG: phosphodiester glycosidase family protein [Pseudomonadota bacterium]
MTHLRTSLVLMMVLVAMSARAEEIDCPYDLGGEPVTWEEREPGISSATFVHPGDKARKLAKVYAHILRIDLTKGLQPVAMRPQGGGLRLEQIAARLGTERDVDVRAGLNGDYFSFGDRVKDPLGLFISQGQVLRYSNGTSTMLYDYDGGLHMGVYQVEQVVQWDGGEITLDAANETSMARRDHAVFFSGVYTDSIKALKECWVIRGRTEKVEPMVNRTVTVTVADAGWRRSVSDLSDKDLVVVACGEKGQALRVLETGASFSISTKLVGMENRPVAEGISGGPRVLRAGKAGQEAGKEGFSLALRLYIPQRHPRSALGLSADRKSLYLMAVEGRGIRRSGGLTAYDTGCVLRKVGASDGMLFDGGGSAVLMYDGGFLNEPHRGRDYTSRDLANALGVIRIR